MWIISEAWIKIFFRGVWGGGRSLLSLQPYPFFLRTCLFRVQEKYHPTCIDQFLADIFQNYLCLYEVCKSCRLPGHYPDLPDGGHHTGNHIRVQSLKVFMVAWCLNPINYNTKYFALIFFCVVLCRVVRVRTKKEIGEGGGGGVEGELNLNLLCKFDVQWNIYKAISIRQYWEKKCNFQ